MNPARDPFELAGEYVLGTLPAEGRREVEQSLPQDAALRAAVDFWESRLLPLTALADPVTPSPGLWTRIELALPPPPPAARPARWWERLDVWRALAAGGFAAAAVMAAVVGLRLQQPEPPRYMVVLAAPQNATPGWVLKMVDADTLRLEPLAGTAVPDQRALQLWTKADGWTGPVSLGLVRPGRAVEVELGKLPPVQPNQLFEITLEPAAGSPIGRPTGPILYIGRAVSLL
ncbi:anti-sigma factor [Massilia sp. DD77]|uniref:anti-sigma factor n=1 Tax=Massilia sp. DD77 TaxID=3109349 RepID=UPI002FFE3E47